MQEGMYVSNQEMYKFQVRGVNKLMNIINIYFIVIFILL